MTPDTPRAGLARIFPLLAPCLKILFVSRDIVISNDRSGPTLRIPTDMGLNCRYRPIVSFGKVGGGDDPPAGTPAEAPS